MTLNDAIEVLETFYYNDKERCPMLIEGIDDKLFEILDILRYMKQGLWMFDVPVEDFTELSIAVCNPYTSTRSAWKTEEDYQEACKHYEEHVHNVNRIMVERQFRYPGMEPIDTEDDDLTEEFL